MHHVERRDDYDQTVKVEGTKIQCYSKKMMEKLYPNEEYTLIGETKRKCKKKQIAMLNVWRSRFYVAEPDTHSKFFYRKVGWMSVGQDRYVVILKHRFAFLIWFLGMLAGVGAAGWILWAALRPDDPVIIDPDHPLPTEDPYADTIPEDEEGGSGEAETSPDGGGSVSMIYTLTADITLSTGEIKMYFRNPTKSNHDIKLVLYVVSGGEEYPLAQSGLLKAGSGLETMTLLDGAAQLQPGTYSGKYLLYYYDSKTGEKALVEPEITDLVITVNP